MSNSSLPPWYRIIRFGGGGGGVEYSVLFDVL